MKITIKNEQETGVTITEVHIHETKTNYSVSILPSGAYTIDFPELESCHVAVTYNESNLPQKCVGRPSPVTGDSSVSLVKSHKDMEPILV